MLNLLSQVFFFSTIAHGCITPSGFGTGTGEIDPSTIVDLRAEDPFDNVIFDVFNAHTYFYEGPVEFRLNAYAFLSIYNAIVPFETVAIDSFARTNVTEDRRICQDAPDAATFLRYRDVTLLYAFAFRLPVFFPDRSRIIFNSQSSIADTIPILDAAGIDPYLCDNPDYDCTDESTPWGIAWTAVQEMYQFGWSDGFNSLGDYNRDFNLVPYEDWRRNPYFPENCPGELEDEDLWQPIGENDGVGFQFDQRFVTAHAGFSGRSLFLSDEKRCSYRAPDPEYDYDVEIPILIERLSQLTDEKKMEIEKFDLKLNSLTLMFNQYYGSTRIKNGETDPFLSTEYWLYLAMSFVSEYESMLIVWREKVRWQRIRPTNIVRARIPDEEITTYAGVDVDGFSEGTQTFYGRDFQPYIRVMPHAEYPSGGACFCTAFSTYMVELEGIDDVTSVTENGEPLFIDVEALSSRVEPASTPQNAFQLTYDSWSEMAAACGQTRLNGGMHFDAAVQQGAPLCAPSGVIVAQAAKALLNGETPEYVADFDDDTLVEDWCEDENEESEESGRGRGGNGERGENDRRRNRRRR